MNATPKNLTLISTPEIKLTPEDGISIYRDGSGSAADEYESNRKTIRERMDVLKLLTLFIEKHRGTLAGLYWRVAYLDPEIELHWSYYRGQQVTPYDIKDLWPAAFWERVADRYNSESYKNTRDWLATVDGVRLRIIHAEKIIPRPERYFSSKTIPRRKSLPA
jgi:hypothetical protein